jgi:histidine ammonia-lyase
MSESAQAVARVAELRPVYGRTTGVGARRDEAADAHGEAHAMRLLRSHSGGLGHELASEEVRALLLARLAQLAVGGSGAPPELADALAGLLNDGRLPRVHDLGGVGTGDLTVFAEVGLALAGEGVASDGDPLPARFTPGPGDALPLLSSNAATIAVATLAWADARRLSAAAPVVAAFTFHAVDGNAEAFDAAVAQARPLPGVAAVSAELRLLVEGAGEAARLQDPYGLRAAPQVEGALRGALDALDDVLAIELDASPENPLVVPSRKAVINHGNFHTAHLALALDTTCRGMVGAAGLSHARLGLLMETGFTGQLPFLADAEPASSGALVVEYFVADAMARLRGEARSDAGADVHLSRGVENHASFAWQCARSARRAVAHARVVYAVELLAAVRALGMSGRAVGPNLAPLLARARAVMAADTRDRPLADDIRAAEHLLDEFGASRKNDDASRPA